jgi:hypothetical protein
VSARRRVRETRRGEKRKMRLPWLRGGGGSGGGGEGGGGRTGARV